eukprot:2942552-Prymnesium_polylepis.1
METGRIDDNFPLSIIVREKSTASAISPKESFFQESVGREKYGSAAAGAYAHVGMNSMHTE